jgi:hypothetical protein
MHPDACGMRLNVPQCASIRSIHPHPDGLPESVIFVQVGPKLREGSTRLWLCRRVLPPLAMEPTTDSLLDLLTADIPDPTDFHSPSLRQLDAALRCTICSEWFDAPVTLACSHCFCSLVSCQLLVYYSYARSGGRIGC